MYMHMYVTSILQSVQLFVLFFLPVIARRVSSLSKGQEWKWRSLLRSVCHQPPFLSFFADGWSLLFQPAVCLVTSAILKRRGKGRANYVTLLVSSMCTVSSSFFVSFFFPFVSSGPRSFFSHRVSSSSPVFVLTTMWGTTSLVTLLFPFFAFACLKKTAYSPPNQKKSEANASFLATAPPPLFVFIFESRKR